VCGPASLMDRAPRPRERAVARANAGALPARLEPDRRVGFTLIEMMAVVLIAGLLLALVAPGLSTTRLATLRAASREMAAHIELARQRAVMTGAPHRLLIDLEEGAYRIDWYVTEARATGTPEAELPAPDEEPTDEYGDAKISLAPPANDGAEFHPIPRKGGKFTYLDDRLYFEGVDTAEGWLEGGEVEIVFDWDGTTDSSEIVISDADDHTMRLQVRPLLDIVRIVDEGREESL